MIDITSTIRHIVWWIITVLFLASSFHYSNTNNNSGGIVQVLAADTELYYCDPNTMYDKDSVCYQVTEQINKNQQIYGATIKIEPECLPTVMDDSTLSSSSSSCYCVDQSSELFEYTNSHYYMNPQYSNTHPSTNTNTNKMNNPIPDYICSHNSLHVRKRTDQEVFTDYIVSYGNPPPDNELFDSTTNNNDDSSSNSNIYNKVYLEGYDLGIQQTIDGTDAEKEAIRDVLYLMNDYWKKEVLSLPHYESVRRSCMNQNELCAFWASIGECESNRLFMIPNCAAACRFCLLAATNLATNVS